MNRRAPIKTIGDLIVRRRKELGIRQKDLAALLTNRDERPLSSTYLNYIEHNHGLPPNYLLDQLADVLKLPVDLLYFWARRLAPDVPSADAIGAERILEACREFRRMLSGHEDYLAIPPAPGGDKIGALE
jgi:transcriptional regulator with XRE-family HTH domain